MERPPATELAGGLWRWTAPHPEWIAGATPGSPDDWEQTVGSVLYETGERTALIDPLLPPEGAARERFLAWLDERVGGRPVSVLTTNTSHRRDREALAERYAGRSSRAWNAVPAGVEPKPLRGAGETVYWLPGAAALVFGDSLLGDGSGGVRLCPESWLSEVRVDRAGLAHQMRRLLELPVERLLVSHGEPVLHDGRASLARAIADASGS
jgi:glyoxylase-like metal-dependent hydrolase (beta-lactamase superfamily II)